MTARTVNTSSDTLSSSCRMPAEWEHHEATWMAWPHFQGDWPGKFEPIPWVYAEIIRNIGRHERVELIVNDASAQKRASRFLKRADALSHNVRFHRWPTNRVWVRDSGCIFLVRKPGLALPDSPGRLSLHEPSDALAVKWRFNAWAKYSNWKFDEKVGSRMAKTAHAEEVRPLWGKSRVVLEGGSIDVNGK